MSLSENQLKAVTFFIYAGMLTTFVLTLVGAGIGDSYDNNAKGEIGSNGHNCYRAARTNSSSVCDTDIKPALASQGFDGVSLENCLTATLQGCYYGGMWRINLAIFLSLFLATIVLSISRKLRNPFDGLKNPCRGLFSRSSANDFVLLDPAGANAALHEVVAQQPSVTRSPTN